MRRIFLSVILAHLFLLLILNFSENKKVYKGHIRVQTFKSFHVPNATISHTPPVKTKGFTNQKKEITTKTEKKETKSLVKKSAPLQNVIEELEQSIAQLSSKEQKVIVNNNKKAFGIPAKIELSIDREDSVESGEVDLELLLISELKSKLALPEFGEVKVKLIVGDFGKVKEILVLHSKSDKNKIYLEEELKTFSFPWILSGKKREFVITFKNEI